MYSCHLWLSLTAVIYSCAPPGPVWKAIRNAVDAGTVDSIFDKVWYQRAVMAAGSGSIVDVQKAQAYWKGKGITVKTLADIDKVTTYMVKKYGKDGKLNGKKSK